MDFAVFVTPGLGDNSLVRCGAKIAIGATLSRLATLPDDVQVSSGFASYVGWLLPFNAPIVLVLPVDEALTEAMTQLVRIGWSRVEGYLPGEVARWREHGGAVSRYDVVSADDLCEADHRGERPTVLDVRQELGWAWRVPGSQLIFVADLPARLREIPGDDPVWVICSNGHRRSRRACPTGPAWQYVS